MIYDLLSLNRLFATNLFNQLTGGSEAMKQFVPRQQLKMRTYFTMIDFWEKISKELQKGVFHPSSLEEGGKVYAMFEEFQHEMTGIFGEFEIGVSYTDEGLFERWRDGLGKMLNRAVLGSRSALYREMEYEFERFWVSFFQLVREPEPLKPQHNADIVVDKMLTLRAANFTKLRELGLDPAFLETDEGDINTIALKQQVAENYLEKDIVISRTVADESAEMIAERILPGVMSDAAAMFTDSLDGATLLKVYRVHEDTQAGTDKSTKTIQSNVELKQAILRELGMELRYSLQVAIALSRILYQSLKDNEKVKAWMDTALPKESSKEVIRILEGGLPLALIATKTEPIEALLVNSSNNDLSDLHFTAFDPVTDKENSLKVYFENQPKPFSEVSNLTELFEAAWFAGKLRRNMPGADEIIIQHFSQYDKELPIAKKEILEVMKESGFADPPTINHLLQKITFKPLWARDEAWLDRSLHFLANKIDVLNMALEKLRVAVLDSPSEQKGTDFLFSEVGDRLCMVYAYHSVLTWKEDIQEILVARLQEQLYGRIASQLDDIHDWVANAVAINLKNLLMADLSDAYMDSPNPDKNQVKKMGVEENYLENLFPEWSNKMDASFVEPMRKKLSLSLDLQLGHEFPDYKVLEDFNYLQDYDKSTIRGALGSFLQSVSDVLSQSFTVD